MELACFIEMHKKKFSVNPTLLSLEEFIHHKSPREKFRDTKSEKMFKGSAEKTDRDFFIHFEDTSTISFVNGFISRL